MSYLTLKASLFNPDFELLRLRNRFNLVAVTGEDRHTDTVLVPPEKGVWKKRYRGGDTASEIIYEQSEILASGVKLCTLRISYPPDPEQEGRVENKRYFVAKTRQKLLVPSLPHIDFHIDTLTGGGGSGRDQSFIVGSVSCVAENLGLREKQLIGAMKSLGFRESALTATPYYQMVPPQGPGG